MLFLVKYVKVYLYDIIELLKSKSIDMEGFIRYIVE